jgi:hypothetical protein
MSPKVRNLNISKNELDALIDEEIGKMAYGELLPTDWTVKRLLTERKLSETTARRLLKRLVASGKAKVYRVRDEKGDIVKAYRA